MIEPEPRVWPTPAEDYDPVADARQHLVWIAEILDTAESLGDLEDDPEAPLVAGYFAHGVTLVKALELALRVAGGQAQRACEAAARRRGLEYCRQCARWLPNEQVIRRSTGGKSDRSNTYLACRDCEGPDEGERDSVPALEDEQPAEPAASVRGG